MAGTKKLSRFYDDLNFGAHVTHMAHFTIEQILRYSRFVEPGSTVLSKTKRSIFFIPSPPIVCSFVQNRAVSEDDSLLRSVHYHEHINRKRCDDTLGGNTFILKIVSRPDALFEARFLCRKVSRRMK